jgi:hypothetical protein
MDFTDAIQQGDACVLFLFSVIMMFIGDRMINSQPVLRIWGLRISALAFVGFTVFHITDHHSSGASEYAMAAIVGLLGGLVTLGPAWIVLAIFGFVGGYYRQAAASATSAGHQRKIKREQKIAEERKRHEQIEWERNAPERERAYREAELRQQDEAKKKADSQKRRSNARADSEMLYQLYAPEIGVRFPRAALDDWTKRYMGDDQSANDVEQRAEQLRNIITHHREQVNPTPQFSTLQELVMWFQNQKSQIEVLPIDDRLRRMLLANLNVRNAELMKQVLDDTK